MKVKIEILYTPGCRGFPKALKTVREAVGELGVEAEIIPVEVRSEEDALKLRFPGSPTVRVNGEDIEPALAGGGLRCRLYRHPDGLKDYPPREPVRRAIETAFGGRR